ncbi:anti-sigma B factor antagonist [Actinacidiphila alni]|uniref:Anti-sigma factor antagonist n=1 Tax=Actinacidiphila alni TaxID=380248 RepID=A0A1I2LD44_9ACTN|nr:STAS domain-containing protein [Actinacidiphila alni]SFF77322.1 anti-sigma B factor antagonist [Actinacidiphila alni]
MSESMSMVSGEASGDVAILAPEGELDHVTTPGFYNSATAALETHSLLVLDLSGLEFCDSTGLNALLRLQRRAKEAGGSIALVAPSQQVVLLLRMTATEQSLPVYDSRDQAVEAMRGRTNS